MISVCPLLADNSVNLVHDWEILSNKIVQSSSIYGFDADGSIKQYGLLCGQCPSKAVNTFTRSPCTSDFSSSGTDSALIGAEAGAIGAFVNCILFGFWYGMNEVNVHLWGYHVHCIPSIVVPQLDKLGGAVVFDYVHSIMICAFTH